MPLHITREFDSWYEYVTCVADTRLRQWKRHNSSHTVDGDPWRGTATFDEAIDMALNKGWPEGRKMMADSYAIIAPRPEPFRSQIFSVAGAFPSVPVYIAGSPECMVENDNENIAVNPIVKIDYTNGGICTVSAKSLMLRGAAVLSLCDQLERRGYSTEINLVSHTTSGHREYGAIFDQRVVIKQAGEPIDLDRMAFSLAQPATHRRLHFALIEQEARLEPIFGGSYGSTSRTPENPRENAITIPGASGDNETVVSARLAVAIAASAFLVDNNLSDLGERLEA